METWHCLEKGKYCCILNKLYSLDLEKHKEFLQSPKKDDYYLFNLLSKPSRSYI